MGRRTGGARVLGPYEERHRGAVRFRVVQVADDGARTTHFATSKKAARLLVKACRIDLGIQVEEVFTVGMAVEQFVASKKKVGAWSQRTHERTGADIRFFCKEAPDAPVGAVDEPWVRGYLERLGGLALASQRSRVHAAREFVRWCIRRGYLRKDPFDAIDPSELPWVGKRARRNVGRGKPQLRNAQEAKAYLEAAAALPKARDRVAAALPLVGGLRSGEVRHLRVGDVDFVAGKLWIRPSDDNVGDDEGWDVKTATSRRTVDLPEDLRADLEHLCDGREPTELLFQSNRGDRSSFERKWLNRLVQRTCEAAGTRVVCAHGLRDTYTSLLASLARVSHADIARLVGHADNGVTARRHYIGQPQHSTALALGAPQEAGGDVA